MNCPLNIWKTDKSVLTVFLIFYFFLGSMDSTFFPPGLLKHSNISEHNSYQVIGRCSWRHFIVGLFIVKNNYEHKDTMLVTYLGFGTSILFRIHHFANSADCDQSIFCWTLNQFGTLY